MGSSDYDAGYSIDVCGNGNVYVAGASYASWGAPVSGHKGDCDVFVTKLNSSGVRQWNTFMGSSAWDGAGCVAVDSSENVYVAGYSEANWGSPVNPFKGDDDVFIAKLNSCGVRQWNTFMGSSSSSSVGSIAVDDSGNVFVSGETSGTFVAKFFQGGWNPGIPFLLLDSDD